MFFDEFLIIFNNFLKSLIKNSRQFVLKIYLKFDYDSTFGHIIDFLELISFNNIKIDFPVIFNEKLGHH